MGRMQASKYSGPGSLSNSSSTAKRRWFTELRTKIALGTRVWTVTQGQTLLASIDTALISPAMPSFANNKACASLSFVGSQTSGNTNGTGSMTFYQPGKTLNRVVRLQALFIGPPDPLRSGS